ncbi:MAG: hypothetical protein ACT443_07550 [Gemmatimonadota bacterium]
MLLTKIRKELRSRDSRFTAIEGTVASSYFDADYETLNEADARVVEGDRLRALEVGTAEASAFSAFLDGIQRAEIKFSYDAVPIVYGYGAAVVRERVERQMRTYRRNGTDLLLERAALFFPSEHVPRHIMSDFGAGGPDLVDITPEGSESLPLFPPLLYARAKQFVNRWRAGLERELAARWAAAPAGWLLIDGSLTVAPEAARCTRACGIIKSHRTRFFDGDDARVVLKLEPGQRSSVFEPAIREESPVRSWYLRLHPAERRDVFWGLVRVEMAPTHDPAMADRISRWLLAEARPLSLPDARWDRLMYPIRDCEAFLRARAPRL